MFRPTLYDIKCNFYVSKFFISIACSRRFYYFTKRVKTKQLYQVVLKGARVNADGNGTHGIAEGTRIHDECLRVGCVHVDQ